ncbi:hypothetical protein N8590_02555 [bacterium]|jgi:hypothetical protein|nr:hypothetical protein [bacterium]
MDFNNKKQYDLFSINLVNQWGDLSLSSGISEGLITIADTSSGVGAIQISAAKFKSGVTPRIDISDLKDLLSEFSNSRNLANPFDEKIYQTELMIYGQSFLAERDFIRVWYASNGTDLLLVTYVCEWEQRHNEEIPREMIIESISIP